MTPLRTIGMIGGMSWESTAVYYRVINERVAAIRGGLHSARCLLYSFDFAEIEELQSAGAWEEAALRMVEAALTLEAAGADGLLICTNTMHIAADALENSLQIPLLHIADATAARIHDAGFTRVGLLGTRFTMEQPFYRDRLVDRHGLDVRVPGENEREQVHRIIYDELCRGRVEPASRSRLAEIVHSLRDDDCESIILGCTELGLLLGPDDSPLPMFDTTIIHAESAADWAMRSS